MRKTGSIVRTIDGATVTGSCAYPDEWCFAFNDQYVTVDMPGLGSKTLTLSVTAGSLSQSIKVDCYGGKASIYVSRLLQLLLTDYKKARLVNATLVLKYGSVTIFDCSLFVIWGKMKVGDKFSAFGDFILNDGEQYFERHIAWFTALPFSVTTFRRTTTEQVSASPVGTYQEDGETKTLGGDIFRYPITVDTSGTIPMAELMQTTNTPVEIVLFTGVTVDYYYVLQDGAWQSVRWSVYNAAPEDQRYRDNKKGKIMAKDGQGKYYETWNSTTLPIDAYLTGSQMIGFAIRDEVEWDDHGKVVRWDSKAEEPYYPDLGNAAVTGIMELRPSQTWRANDIVTASDGRKYIAVSQDGGATSRALYLTLDSGKPTYTVAWDFRSTGTFDETFDFTFNRTYIFQVLTEKIILEKRDESVGYYLRWIDRFGYINYFLFVKGENTTKTTVSSDEVESGFHYGGLIYDTRRAMKVESQKSIKCCACNLTQEMVGYVESIIESPHVDLYLGMSKGGKEVWMPVQVGAGSYKTKPLSVLQDYEITLNFNKETMQNF